MTVDEAVLRYFQAHVTDGLLTGFMKAVTFLGEGGWFWIALTIVLLIIPYTRRAGAASAIALICSLVFTDGLLKNLIARPRPYQTFEDIALYMRPLASYSFPSGHTSSAFASAAAIIWTHKKYGWPLLLPAALIGFSRVYLSMHYLTDVLGGIAAGCVYAAVGAVIAAKVKNRKFFTVFNDI